MSLQVTLLELRNRTLLRADMVNSPFRDSAEGGEVDDVINAEWRKAYRLLVAADDDYTLSSEDITTTQGTSVYALPSTFYKLKGLDAFPNGTTGDAQRVPKFRWDERNRYATASGWTTFGPSAYRLRGSNLVLYPTPPAGITLRAWYHPAPVNMADDTDTIDIVTGIDELIVVGAAKTLLLEEGDIEAAAALNGEYQALAQQVMADVQGRSEPEQAADVIREGFW